MRRSRSLRQNEDGPSAEGAKIVDYVGMKAHSGWTVHMRGQWARHGGRVSLPQSLAKRAGRRCACHHDEHAESSFSPCG